MGKCDDDSGNKIRDVMVENISRLKQIPIIYRIPKLAENKKISTGNFSTFEYFFSPLK